MTKVFCTGSSGFVGSNLIPELLKKNLEVYALERYVTGRFSETKNGDVNKVTADLNDHLKVKEAIAQIKPEYVIHLAAISPVAYSYEHYAEVLKTNFEASVNLFEVNRQYNPNLEQILVAGTSEEYGIQEHIPIPETADLRPNSPYSVSKVAMDRYLQYMRDAYRFPMTLLRSFNTYGRSTNTHFVTEKILSQMLSDQPVVMLGDPTPIRDLMYVSDHVNAYLTCLGNEDAKEKTFNFCTSVGTSIRELVDICARLTDWKGTVEWQTIANRPTDIKILVGDNTKARKQLAWSPKVDLEEGLKMTIKELDKCPRLASTSSSCT